jgi:uncharacterized protein (TIGR02271 family)
VENRRQVQREERRTPPVAGETAHARAPSDETVIPVMQEELAVGRRRVETESGVRVSKTVEARDETVDIPLMKEAVNVERVPINRPLDSAPAVRYEGEVMIVPIVEEVVVVEKRLMLKEEIRISRHKAEVREPQRVTLRTEHARVERIEGPYAERIEDADDDRLGRSSHTGAAALDDSTAADSTAQIDETRARENAATDAGDSLLERKRQQDEERRQGLSSR